MDGIGVLELVEQKVCVARAESAPNVPAVARVSQHRAREHEQVVEFELTAAAAGVGLAQRELSDLPRQSPDGGFRDGLRDRRRPLAHGGHARADTVDVTR